MLRWLAAASICDNKFVSCGGAFTTGFNAGGLGKGTSLFGTLGFNGGGLGEDSSLVGTFTGVWAVVRFAKAVKESVSRKRASQILS